MNRAAAVVAAGALVVAACGDDGGGSVEAFCESTQEFVDVSEFGDGDDIAGGLEEYIDAINTMADDAPSEISDDANAAVEVFNEAFDDVDPTDEEAVFEAMATHIWENSDPEFTEAVKSLDEFALTECGIEL